MDDVEDDSQLRRGQPGILLPVEVLHYLISCTPVTHKIYGIPQTVNSANYVYFLAYKELFSLRDGGSNVTNKGQQLDYVITSKLDSLSCLTCNLHFCLDELLNLHRGQGLDLLWRDSLTCPTEEEYIHMVINSSFVSFLPWLCNSHKDRRNGRIISYSNQANDGEELVASVCFNHPVSCPKILFACRDYVPLVNLFSIYFQIRDDYMNLQSQEVSNHH